MFTAAPVVKYSESENRVRTPPPMLGEHTEEVLKTVLQLSSSEIRLLADEKIVQLLWFFFHYSRFCDFDLNDFLWLIALSICRILCDNHTEGIINKCHRFFYVTKASIETGL